MGTRSRRPQDPAPEAAGLTYVLITPARNEAKFIGLTIASVVAQTIQPARWVIVSDGSTDGTDEIVSGHAAQHPWIELVRTPARAERHFAGKVHAFNVGLAAVHGISYDVIASLDADITLDPEHFAFLLGKLSADPRLGLVGTPFKDTSTYDYRFVSIEHVSGACQVFRRACFEDVGGYVPIKSGGVDHVAVITARMKGWKTRTFTEKICLHHRDIGSAEHGAVTARFRAGALDYALGGHPMWEVCRALYQMTRRPIVVGGLALLAGYLRSMIRRVERPVSAELVRFRRREQMQRLKTFLIKVLTFKSSNVPKFEASQPIRNIGP
jgi:biofilm PGA synthesis N-glycosyltransferase PgaC